MSLLLHDQRNCFAFVRLNRPEKLNALSRALISELSDTFKQLEIQKDLRAVILTGQGRAFCAGTDINELATLDENAALATSLRAVKSGASIRSLPLAVLEWQRLAASQSLPIYFKSLLTCCPERKKLLQPAIHEGNLNGGGFRFAIIASRWNDFISSRLVDGALDALERLGAEEKLVEVYKVPGAFEIPLLALKLAGSGKFDAVICLGTIIRGQTPHFEYIAREVACGIAQAGLQTGVPVVFGVITADTLDQAIDRAGVKLGNKGFEAATTAVELVNLYKAVTSDK